jgi:non-specific serine/threonine protein kinase
VAYRRLADAYMQWGDIGAATRSLHKVLAIDPLQEDIHRLLMRHLALSGRHDEALSQYKTCAQILRHELELEPSLATRQLNDRILARRERPPDNLPASATSMVGREREIDQIKNSLLDPDTRLLTLVGVGGIGKTRLSLEVAYRLSNAFLEGIWFMDLAPVEDLSHVAQTIARVLQIPEASTPAADTTHEEDTMARLLDYLASKNLLIILDNCEHVLAAVVPVVDRILRRCPDVKVLVTSRERLALPEEALFVVEPLSIPAAYPDRPQDLSELGQNESIRLFEDRARSVRSRFTLDESNASVVTRICRALDGMPLAIELAASRLRALCLNQMVEKLEQSIQDLEREHKGAIPRHHTLTAAIEWSYNLLSMEEQQLFRISTIFRGGFDLPSFMHVLHQLGIEAGSVDTVLAQLIEKSLIFIREVGEGSSRYFLLEPVRQFGLERMKADPFYASAQDAHADHYLQLAEKIGPKLHGTRRKRYIDQLELEAENLRVSLRRFIRQGEVDECLRFAHALWEGYWLNQGYFTEGRDWVDQVLQINNAKGGFHYGSVRLSRGAFAWTLGNVDEALEHILQALEIGKKIGDARLIQWAYYWQGSVIFDQSKFDAAGQALEKAYEYALQAGEKRGASWSIFYQAQIARVKGQTEKAIRLYRESLEVLAELDVFGATWCYIYLGHLATEQRDLPRAREYLTTSLAIAEDLENPRVVGGTERGLGLLELEAGDLELAEEHLRRSRHIFEQLGWIKMSSSSKIYMGFIAAAQGRVEEGSELLLESLAYQDREQDAHSIAHILFILGLLAVKQGYEIIAGVLIMLAEEMQVEYDVAFPQHLQAAVDQSKEKLLTRGVKPSLHGLTWKACVRLILVDPQEWLGAIDQALESRT